nr:hypothetical protein [Marinicella sp. W31]MDC2879048.1 hypothetical protein [Marinicella sp. W31]
MKLFGLVLVVIGLATLTIRFGFYHYRDVAGDIEGSLWPRSPISCSSAASCF